LIHANQMSWPVRIAYTILMVLSTVCLSRLFEGRPKAWGLESVRAVLLYSALFSAQWFHPVTTAVRMAGLAGLIISVVLLVLLYKETPQDKPLNFGEAA